MSERSARAEMKLRLPKQLRAQLEAEAEAGGGSLNAAIVRHLEQSLRGDTKGDTVFGDPDTFAIVDEFVRLLRAIEMTAGRRWNDCDPIKGRDMLIEACNAMVWLLQNAPSLLAGQPLPVLRDVHAKFGYDALRSMMAATKPADAA